MIIQFLILGFFNRLLNDSSFIMEWQASIELSHGGHYYVCFFVL